MTHDDAMSLRSVGESPASTTVAEPAAKADRPVLLLVNLGTPDEATPASVRRFLREFLSDRRVIETHPLLWRPILDGIVLRVRPAKVARKYASIWTDRGSPLLAGTLDQVDGLRAALGHDVEVRHAMRYGTGSLREALSALHDEGFRKVAVLPAYAQYTASTTATIFDEVARWTLAHRDALEVRTVRSFPVAPAYVDALARGLEDHWERVGRPDFSAGERLLLSFHSIPVAMVRAGDPYREECLATVEALRARLDLPEDGVLVTFQSVFGPAEWIGPATIDTVAELGRAGTRRIDVICPGFFTDCLETLEEIDQLNRETFCEAGGGEFHYVRWGNGSEGAVRALAEQARRVLSGWTR